MSRLRTPRAGFTLVEVMLTTVLAAVLLLALWSLLSMYSKAFEGGHARTEQSQLARVLLEQMSTDFQNVLVAPQSADVSVGSHPGLLVASVSPDSNPLPVQPSAGPSTNAPAVPSSPRSAQPSPSGNGAKPGPSNSNGFVAGTVEPMQSNALPPGGNENEAATSSLRPTGLFGTATFLQIDVVQPAMLAPTQDIEEAVAGPESPPRAAELKTVIYTFEEYRDPANPSAEPTTRLVRSELSWAQAHPAHGVERGNAAAATAGTFVPDSANEVPDSLDARFSETNEGPTTVSLGADEEPLEPTATTIPEVLEFALRYFDGTVWSEEWDSVSRQSLPRAVEVSLRLRSLEESLKPETDELANKGGVDLEKIELLKHPLQRLLIPLPLAPKASGMNNQQLAPAAGGEGGLLGAETHASFDRQ